MLIKLLIISTILLIISFVFLGIRILLKGNGRFPETHVGRNKEMQKRGISCAQDINIGCAPSDGFDSCTTCGKNLSVKG
jgi:hypothetical protein